MSDDGKRRPAVNKAASETPTPSVPKRREWKPDPRYAMALDSHIAHVYGPEYTSGRWVA
jgi:hypothetical protein